jgi:hypothetical protein
VRTQVQWKWGKLQSIEVNIEELRRCEAGEGMQSCREDVELWRRCGVVDVAVALVSSKQS